jgi:hypothetical protein
MVRAITAAAASPSRAENLRKRIMVHFLLRLRESSLALAVGELDTAEVFPFLFTF